MPCSDGGWSERIREKEWEDKISNLQERNDKLIRVICRIDTCFRNDDAWKQFLSLRGNEEVCAVVLEHRATDEQRWWDKYKDKLQEFSKEEIAKMVRAGILDD